MKKKLFIIITIVIAITIISVITISTIHRNKIFSTGTVDEKIEYLLTHMSLKEKLGQMIQAERTSVTPNQLSRYHLGSVLSGGGSTPGNNTVEDWRKMINEYQKAATSSGEKIPIIYGLDAIHGNSHLTDAVIFPHNIALGAANNVNLTKKIGEITAKEMLTTGVPWTFAPCVPVAKDPRWGRFYESYSDNSELTSKLSSTLIKSFQENGVGATAKHYIGDGGTTWGTGNTGYKIDRGITQYDEKNIRKEFLPPYISAIDNNVMSVMVSFSSIDKTNMHANKYWVTDILKNELNFKGFVVSDWEGIHLLYGSSHYEQIILAVNSGIDMLMEPYDWLTAFKDLKKAVKNKDISEERIDDAVSRILLAKFNLGLFDNSKLIDKNTFPLGQASSRAVAKEAVKESLVLLKNKDNILPLKKGSKVYVSGPGANDILVQCGGWTIDWQGGKRKPEGTTLLQGFQEISNQMDSTIITDYKKASEADVSVVVLGEKPYSEGLGDDETLGISEGMGLPENNKALEDAKALGKPIVVVLLSGRPRIVTNLINDWDAFVCAWLPGSEGAGVSEVLYGLSNFKGNLPVNWPKSVNDLPIKDTNESLFPFGYGLNYKE